MSTVSPPALPVQSSGRRSTFVTVLAWFMMVIGVIGLPISAISLLMIIAGSYGTKQSDPLGFLTVVLGPAIILATGFGLLRRWRPAWMITIVVLGVIMGSHVWHLIRGPRPTITCTSPSGVVTTVTGSSSDPLTVPFIAVCAGLLAKLVSKSVQSEFPATLTEGFAATHARDARSGATASKPTGSWQVGHRGRDMMYYEENIDGRWERLDISGEMLMGRAHHVIYFDSAERWQSYPEWARHRRDEIMGRIKSRFSEPDYEYQGDAP